jgi:hypothetical protein
MRPRLHNGPHAQSASADLPPIGASAREFALPSQDAIDAYGVPVGAHVSGRLRTIAIEVAGLRSTNDE